MSLWKGTGFMRKTYSRYKRGKLTIRYTKTLSKKNEALFEEAIRVCFALEHQEWIDLKKEKETRGHRYDLDDGYLGEKLDWAFEQIDPTGLRAQLTLLVGLYCHTSLFKIKFGQARMDTLSCRNWNGCMFAASCMTLEELQTVL